MNDLSLVPLAQVAAACGVTPEQARRYVQRGLLPGRKIAGVWLVSAAHADTLRLNQPRRGRPLLETAAWDQILAGDIDISDPWRYANRGTMTRWFGGEPLLEEILRFGNLIVSGVHASRHYGGMLPPLPGSADLYLPASAADQDDPDSPCHWLHQDPFGGITIRAVNDLLWPRLVEHALTDESTGTLHAPPAAVALDLAMSPHARECDVAEQIAAALQ